MNLVNIKPNSSPAQLNVNVSKLDSFITALSERDLALGSLAVSINGELQYKRAFGYSYIDSSRKVKADTLTKYRIGSISKLFTAVMIFQLIEDGKIRLDDKLADYYPTLQNANKITISDLLYHRSGLHDYTKDTDFKEWMGKLKTQADILKIINDKGVDFEPGSKADYCNSNYLLLGYIIEQVCRMSYGEALKKRITSKIGLKDTYYGNSINIGKHESASYKYSNSNWEKQQETNLSIHGGAGSIVATPTDLVKFIDNLFSYKLVTKSSLDHITTLIDGYGMGIFTNKYGSLSSYGHNGRIEEFYSALWYYPSEKLAVSYCTNGINYPRSDIIEGALKICFNEPFQIPFSALPVVNSRDLDKYLGDYSSKDVPFIITLKKEATKLLVDSKVKSFNLDPIGEDFFMDGYTGNFFQFHPKEGILEVKETDNIYYFKRVSNSKE